MSALIANFGGVPLVAPSVREVPLAENPAAFAFAQDLFAGKIDAVICLTGVGTRTLLEILQTRHAKDEIVQAFARTTVVARGPKPVKVLREYDIPVTIAVPEPNTWREILQELDENPRGFTLARSRIAVQEYGISNEKLLEELRQRGAEGVHQRDPGLSPARSGRTNGVPPGITHKYQSHRGVLDWTDVHRGAARVRNPCGHGTQACQNGSVRS
jgi:uroporphyrinogen-III synthase